MGNMCFSICKRQKNFLIEGKDEQDCQINLLNKLKILYPKNKNEINNTDVLIDGNKKYNIDKMKKLSNDCIVFNVQYINYDNY